MVKAKKRLIEKGMEAKAKSLQTVKPTQLSAEIRARLAALDQFNQDKEERWNARTAAEQKDEIAAWDRIMKRMNKDRKGYREVFVDS